MTSTDRRRGRIQLLALVLCLASAELLQAQPSQPFVDSIDVQVVEVDVVVTDRKGRPIKGLAREDFELYVDGRPVEITNFYESAIYVEEQAGRRKKERPIVRSEGTSGTADEGALTVVFCLDDPNIYPAHRTRLLRRLEAAVEPWRSMDASFMLARFVNRLEVLVPPTRDLDAILAGAATVPKGSPRAIQNGDGARRFAVRSLIDSHEACARTLCRPCHDSWGELLSLARQCADNRATNTAIGADKGRRIAYRRTYRDKSLDERLAERLLSVAYLGNPENPLEAVVDFGDTKLLEKKIHELTVGISVPAESVLNLPSKDDASPNASARLRLWLVAIEDEKGARTTVRQKAIDVGGAAGVAAEGGNYRVEVAMNLPEGDYQVAVGIRDETTGSTSLIREPVSVPSE